MRAPTVESQPRCVRRRRSGSVALSASGGGLFTAEKSPKCAGGCGPRTPMGLRGVHPKKRYRPGRYAPPGRPAPYCPPLPGFARASRIGGPLRLQNFSLRPHPLPRNRRWKLHTAAFARNLSVPAVDNAHCASECLRYQSASVERTRKRFPRRGRCLHRPAPRSGLLLQVRWLRIAVCIAAPLSSP